MSAWSASLCNIIIKQNINQDGGRTKTARQIVWGRERQRPFQWRAVDRGPHRDETHGRNHGVRSGDQNEVKMDKHANEDAAQAVADALAGREFNGDRDREIHEQPATRIPKQDLRHIRKTWH